MHEINKKIKGIRTLKKNEKQKSEIAQLFLYLLPYFKKVLKYQIEDGDNYGMLFAQDVEDIIFAYYETGDFERAIYTFDLNAKRNFSSYCSTIIRFRYLSYIKKCHRNYNELKFDNKKFDKLMQQEFNFHDTEKIIYIKELTDAIFSLPNRNHRLAMLSQFTGLSLTARFMSTFFDYTESAFATWIYRGRVEVRKIMVADPIDIKPNDLNHLFLQRDSLTMFSGKKRMVLDLFFFEKKELKAIAKKLGIDYKICTIILGHFFRNDIEKLFAKQWNINSPGPTELIG